MNKKKNNQPWQDIGNGKNTFLKINKKGQFEILGHIYSDNDISNLCKELFDLLTYEWQVIEEKKKQDHVRNVESNQKLFSNNNDKPDIIPIDFEPKSLAQIKELYPIKNNKTA